MTAPWIAGMFERFGELLVKELGVRGLNRLDGVSGRSFPHPVERHGGWEWTFGRTTTEKQGEKPLNRYMTARLVFVGPPPTEPGKTAMNLFVSVGADNEDRFVRRDIGQVQVTEPDLRSWSQDVWKLLTLAVDTLRGLSADDLSQEYIHRPLRR
jgi:hypothetical protein